MTFLVEQGKAPSRIGKRERAAPGRAPTKGDTTLAFIGVPAADLNAHVRERHDRDGNRARRFTAGCRPGTGTAAGEGCDARALPVHIHVDHQPGQTRRRFAHFAVPVLGGPGWLLVQFADCISAPQPDLEVADTGSVADTIAR